VAPGGEFKPESVSKMEKVDTRMCLQAIRSQNINRQLTFNITWRPSGARICIVNAESGEIVVPGDDLEPESPSPIDN
jgi:hypothetical protein